MNERLEQIAMELVRELHFLHTEIHDGFERLNRNLHCTKITPQEQQAMDGVQQSISDLRERVSNIDTSPPSQ